MSYNRNIQFSSAMYGGYCVEIQDIRLFNNNEEIIKYCVNDLKINLKRINLIELLSKLGNNKFHIHTHTFEKILLTDDNDIIYICDGVECLKSLSN